MTKSNKSLLALAILRLILLALSSTRSQAAPVADDSVEGLTLTFQSKIDGVLKTDSRSARLVTLMVPTGSAPTPFLKPGPFTAKFEGFIVQKIRGDFNFSANGNGAVKISVNDKLIFDANGDLGAGDPKPATLTKGKNKLLVEFTSPAQGDAGDAWLRLMWSSDDFASQPIDPKLFSHSTTDKPIADGLRLREGRSLFADLHCLRCHTDAGLSKVADSTMPELAKDAPDLTEVGQRLNQNWMANWISDPHRLRSDTSMPKVFHGDGASVQQAADIAAYLAMFGSAPADSSPASPAEVTAGGHVIARLGCIGCHMLPDKTPLPTDPYGRVSWHYVKAKFKPAALVEFLKKPEAHYSWIRMPNFRLSDMEAKQVAAYLLANSGDLPASTPQGDADHGGKLMQSAGCMSCHTIKGENQFHATPLASIPGTDWQKGCLGKDDAARGSAPDFSLSDSQREALQAFAATDRSSLQQDALPEFAERQITELRCMACHSRDNKPDVWDQVIKEIEPLAKGDIIDASVKPPRGETQPGTGDQSRPPLTWVGEKLHTKWMETFVAGKLDYKPREWMLARMPGFPTRADGIAQGLVLEHGCDIVSPELVPDPALAKIGRQLVGRNGGFSCVQCHGVGNVGPISPFEAPSINFKYFSERLRKDYYDRWMRDPSLVVPTTKMPRFENDGKTALTDILDGDASKQFDAIWNYLQAGRKIQAPEQ
jgi:mono/diheme cytochrome c family protein